MHIGFLIFSFGFDFVVELVSWCLFFALTFRVIPLLTSTYVCVLVSVCYPSLSATGLPSSIFVIITNFRLTYRFSLPRFRNLASNLPFFRFLSLV